MVHQEYAASVPVALLPGDSSSPASAESAAATFAPACLTIRPLRAAGRTQRGAELQARNPSPPLRHPVRGVNDRMLRAVVTVVQDAQAPQPGMATVVCHDFGNIFQQDERCARADRHPQPVEREQDALVVGQSQAGMAEGLARAAHGDDVERPVLGNLRERAGFVVQVQVQRHCMWGVVREAV